MEPLSVLLAVTGAGSDCCEVPLKTTEEAEEEEEVTASVAGLKTSVSSYCFECDRHKVYQVTFQVVVEVASLLQKLSYQMDLKKNRMDSGKHFT